MTSEHLFAKIELLAIYFDLLMEINVDRTVIGALYRRLNVAVFYPREEAFGDKDIIDLIYQKVSLSQNDKGE